MAGTTAGTARCQTTLGCHRRVAATPNTNATAATKAAIVSFQVFFAILRTAERPGKIPKPFRRRGNDNPRLPSDFPDGEALFADGKVILPTAMPQIASPTPVRALRNRFAVCEMALPSAKSFFRRQNDNLILPCHFSDGETTHQYWNAISQTAERFSSRQNDPAEPFVVEKTPKMRKKTAFARINANLPRRGRGGRLR
jgi:hypothetical protein